LTIHVIGASKEAELWGDFDRRISSSSSCDVYEAYAEALNEIVTEHMFQTIQLVFCGPGCPEENETVIKNIYSESSKKETGFKRSCCKLKIETHCCMYNSEFLKCNSDVIHSGSANKKRRMLPPSADIVVFFNPGFSCPDYDWEASLSSVVSGTPFLVTTNTEMEAIADLQILSKRGYIRALPKNVEQIVNYCESDSYDQDRKNKHIQDDNDIFFILNPYSGSRVRQSGNMANDLFVKNRWTFGGLWCDVENTKHNVVKEKQIFFFSVIPQERN